MCCAICALSPSLIRGRLTLIYGRMGYWCGDYVWLATFLWGATLWRSRVTYTEIQTNHVKGLGYWFEHVSTPKSSTLTRVMFSIAHTWYKFSYGSQIYELLTITICIKIYKISPDPASFAPLEELRPILVPRSDDPVHLTIYRAGHTSHLWEWWIKLNILRCIETTLFHWETNTHNTNINCLLFCVSSFPPFRDIILHTMRTYQTLLTPSFQVV